MANPLKARVAKLLEKARAETAPQSSLLRYQKAPIRYMREVLGVDPWAKQQEIARLLLTPPYKVLGKACHGVGKTHANACLTSWWFDTHPEDSAVITTAP